MAKRYIETNNSRGKQVTAANPTYAHIRGWDAGVWVEASGNDGNTWEVYMTGGSNGYGRSVFLGTVYNTADGPQFVPAGDEMSTDASSPLGNLTRNDDGEIVDSRDVNPDGTYRHPAHP